MPIVKCMICFKDFYGKPFFLKRGHAKYCSPCRIKDERVLAVHHIDRNRKNNKVDNLAWLCHNCHHLVHHHIQEQEKFMETLV